jgi:putative nucleotidyltransferase with HDIG domain
VTHVLTLGTVDRATRLGHERLAVVRSFGRRLANALERASYVFEVADTRQATFRALGRALEFRDLETKGHTDRVVALADALGQRFSLAEADRVALRWGAYLHDLGKVAVPDSILLKADRLTAEEFRVIAQHTLYGVEMCTDLRFLPGTTLQVIRSHHERWDGRGYPDGLAGEEIPLLARLFAVVDVYDALRSERPYKASWPDEAAREEIRNQAGTQFDPGVVDAFFGVLERVPASLAELLTYGS